MPGVPLSAFSPHVVLVGVGEMGGVFARGLLRSGHPVQPILRANSLAAAATELPEPSLVLITVAEADLADVLASLPTTWTGRIGLLQNELLPRDWLAAGIDDPTVAVVWFEKKPGREFKVIIPTPIGGPSAATLVSALKALGIPAFDVGEPQRLEFELVRKNLYILTANIAGLMTAGTVMELWEEHRALAEEVAGEVLDVQEWLTNRSFDREALVTGMVEAFAADPTHQATGRSAPARLARALEHASTAGLSVPTLESIRSKTAG